MDSSSNSCVSLPPGGTLSVRSVVPPPREARKITTASPATTRFASFGQRESQATQHLEEPSSLWTENPMLLSASESRPVLFSPPLGA